MNKNTSTLASNTSTTESVKTYGSGVLFAVLVGFSFVGLKQMVQYCNALEAIAFRYTFAFIALAVCLLLRIIKVNFKGKPVFSKALPVASFYILFMLFQAAGLKFATSIESGIFFAIIPIIVSVISTFVLKEKATIPQALFMLLSISSLIVMILCGATSVNFSVAGVFLLLISSLCMAINNVMMRYLRNIFTAIEMTTVIIIEGFIILNIICLVLGLINGNLMDFLSLITIPKFVIAGVYLAIPCTLVSAALMAYMVRRIVAVKATIFGNVSTAISIVAGVLVLGEPLLWYHILCSILIIVGVIGVSVTGGKDPKIEREVSTEK